MRSRSSRCSAPSVRNCLASPRYGMPASMAKKRKRATPYHSAPFEYTSVLHPIEALIRLLFKTRNRKAILSLFDNRVTWGAVRHWRTGRRAPPMWAREAIAVAVAPKLEEIRRLQELIAVEQAAYPIRQEANRQAAIQRLRIWQFHKREEAGQSSPAPPVSSD